MFERWSALNTRTMSLGAPLSATTGYPAVAGVSPLDTCVIYFVDRGVKHRFLRTLNEQRERRARAVQQLPSRALEDTRATRESSSRPTYICTDARRVTNSNIMQHSPGPLVDRLARCDVPSLGAEQVRPSPTTLGQGQLYFHGQKMGLPTTRHMRRGRVGMATSCPQQGGMEEARRTCSLRIHSPAPM